MPNSARWQRPSFAVAFAAGDVMISQGGESSEAHVVVDGLLPAQIWRAQAESAPVLATIERGVIIPRHEP